jgi:hypothetical protein
MRGNQRAQRHRRACHRLIVAYGSSSLFLSFFLSLALSLKSCVCDLRRLFHGPWIVNYLSLLLSWDVSFLINLFNLLIYNFLILFFFFFSFFNTPSFEKVRLITL